MEPIIDTSLLPPMLYKYRTWDNKYHKRIITDSEFFFGSPCIYQEDHEFNLPVDYDSITNEDLIEYYIRVNVPLGLTEMEKRRVAINRAKLSSFHNSEIRTASEEEFRINLCKTFRIFCISMNKEIENCWGSYSSGDSGFCVGLNTKKIVSLYGKDWGGGIVEYFPQHKLPYTKPAGFADEERERKDMMKTIFSLPIMYSFEKEFRFVKQNMGSNCVILDKEIIEEVNLGYKMTSFNRNEIIQIIKKELPNTKIFDTKYDLEQHKYYFELIK